VLLLMAGCGTALAQENPIQWTIEEGKRSKDTVTVRVTAKIADTWHLYSITQPPGGPIPTRIWIPEDQPFKMTGEIRGPKPESSYDSNFSMDVAFYEGVAEFQLPVKPTTTSKQTLHVKASYQTCNDRLCLPPKTVALELEIDHKK
jgi:thiol:disulfide interchange protein DsbD